ncbi:Bax inhibitor-1/YccA family protein [Streptomyces sp. NPDC006333]|uniref:Bax inhibitor-1/YccA family protein n=1 Tax=Streptomyces sp. NPDC006333 TaxID=3156753 RepID=UPI0033A04A87
MTYFEKRSPRSTNPVLRQWERTRDPAHAQGDTLSAHYPATVGHPAQVPHLHDTAASQTGAGAGVMTIDDVVARTAITLGVVVLSAVLSWLLLPVDPAHISTSYGIATAAGLAALALAFIHSFKAQPLPALIVGYAAFEGVFLGVISSATSSQLSPGVVIEAVAGTMAVFAAVLVAYKRRWIRVTSRFSGFVTAAALGFLILTVANLVFSAVASENGFGLRTGVLGILFGVIGIVLGACFLALHFKQIEDGIAAGVPRQESWLAAFGLTVTLVWIYIETLNLLTLASGDDVI